MKPLPAYAIVALDGPSHTADGRYLHVEQTMGLLLHYRVPSYLEGRLEPGHLVEVRLRGRPTFGVVVELSGESPVDETHPINRLVDAQPLVSPSMLALAKWIATYYQCTLWQALAPMLPPGVARKTITTVHLATESDPGSDPLLAALGRRQKQVVSLLQSSPKSALTISTLRKRYEGAISGLDDAIRGLEREGLVTRQTALPSPRSRPQQERIIRLSTSTEAISVALNEAARRAPLQAAALDWLRKRAGTRGQVSGAGESKDGFVSPFDGSENAEVGSTGSTGDGWLPLRDLYLHTGATSATVSALERKGLVELSERPAFRKSVRPTASSASDEPPPLTTAQAAALREIAAALRGPTTDDGRQVKDPGWQSTDLQRPTTDDRLPTTFLLHGVTGSGKTEIYLRAIGMALRMKRQALVLVPEISLTPQAVHRFASRFPGRVALIHSQLPAGQQFDEWRRIHKGHADIVIGSRSAVFAPLPRLGLIVVDEEHEWAYKQDHVPRYHARDVALKRAEGTGSVVILGSATPDLVTYHRAQQGDYRLLSLPSRVGRRRARDGSHLITELPMPPVQVVDMRAELRAGNDSLFSRALRGALDATLSRQEQAILYLNRRGSHSFMLCRECGYVPLCKRCDVPLVYHADVYELLCHRCNAHSLIPKECARCGSSQIKGFGVGTQRVVDEVAALFPRARVLRWDRDTASRQGGHEGIMEIFARGDADVLVGTQMIAKGLDIDRVTLVGVTSADTGLFLPDFRAPERSLQLLMQVAGRAGRRTETTHSRVVVQTFNPEHYAIQAAARHDYKGFYTGEIRFRAEHGYPPYGQIARFVYSHQSNAHCEQVSNVVARHLRRKAEELAKAEPETGSMDVLGPAPCFIHKVRGRYRWQILLRAGSVTPLLDDFYPGSGWSLDIDPLSVL